jgi:hypothetical protein
MYQRQASFRSGVGPLAGATPFKRGSRGQLSLRPNDLPSTKERRNNNNNGGSLLLLGDSSPIMEDIELPSSALEDNISSTTASSLSTANQYNNQAASLDLLTCEDPFSFVGRSEASSSSGTSSPVALVPFSSSAHSFGSHLQPVRLLHQTGGHDNAGSPWGDQQGVSPGGQLAAETASSLTSSYGGPSSLSSLPGNISTTNGNHYYQQQQQYSYRPESLASLGSSSTQSQRMNTTTSAATTFSSFIPVTTGSQYQFTASGKLTCSFVYFGKKVEDPVPEPPVHPGPGGYRNVRNSEGGGEGRDEDD